MEFIKLSNSVKAESLGGATTAMGGLQSININPAGLSRLDRIQVEAQYLYYIENISYKHVNAAYPLPFGVMSLSAGYVDLGLQARTTISDKEGASGDTFSNSGFQMGIGISQKKKNWNYGAALKAVHENLDTYSSLAYGLDMGVQKEVSPDLRMGASITNLTLKKSRYISQENRLSETYRLGVQKETSWKHIPVWVSTDLSYATDEGLYISAGVEAKYYESLLLRVGYSGYGDWNSLSLGLGLNMNPLILDFSYKPNALFGDTFRVGIGMMF